MRLCQRQAVCSAMTYPQPAVPSPVCRHHACGTWTGPCVPARRSSRAGGRAAGSRGVRSVPSSHPALARPDPAAPGPWPSASRPPHCTPTARLTSPTSPAASQQISAPPLPTVRTPGCPHTATPAAQTWELAGPTLSCLMGTGYSSAPTPRPPGALPATGHRPSQRRRSAPLSVPGSASSSSEAGSPLGSGRAPRRVARSTATASKGTDLSQFPPSWFRHSRPGAVPQARPCPSAPALDGVAQRAAQWVSVLTSLQPHLLSPPKHGEGEGRGKAPLGLPCRQQRPHGQDRGAA